MRRLRYAIVIALGLPVLLALGVFAWPDAELSPEARRWVETAPQAPPGPNLFDALVGLQAAADADPFEVGARMVRAANAAVDAPGAGDLVLPPEWTEPALRFDPAVPALCSPGTGRCLEAWRAEADAIADLAAAHEVLLARYEALFPLPIYVNTLRADYRAPMPPARALLDVHRLWLARLGATFDPAEPAAAEASLRLDMALARRLLAGAEAMLMKMVAASVFATDLHAYAAFAAAASVPGVPEDIEPLGRGALDLGRCIAGEFRLVYSGIGSIAHGRTGALTAGAESGFGERAASMLFKPNRAANLAYRHFAILADRAGLPAAEFARVHRASGGKTIEPRWSDRLLDPVGTLLFSAGWSDLSRYQYRLYDLQGLVTLLNARLALLREAVPEAQTGNWLAERAERFHGPYDSEPLRFDAAARELWFESPGADPFYSRLAM